MSALEIPTVLLTVFNFIHHTLQPLSCLMNLLHSYTTLNVERSSIFPFDIQVVPGTRRLRPSIHLPSMTSWPLCHPMFNCGKSYNLSAHGNRKKCQKRYQNARKSCSRGVDSVGACKHAWGHSEFTPSPRRYRYTPFSALVVFDCRALLHQSLDFLTSLHVSTLAGPTFLGAGAQNHRHLLSLQLIGIL